MALNAPQLNMLGEYDRQQLKLLFTELSGYPVPSHSSLSFLRAQISWMLQAKKLGKNIDAFQLQMIKKLERADVNSASTPRPGTRLVREWHGDVYQVEVLQGSFEFEGCSYHSLSQIAQKITGTKWSGPRFFGLTVNRHE